MSAKSTGEQVLCRTAVVCRVLLGLTFIFSGFVKAVDPLGTAYKIEDYLNAFGGFFADLTWAALPASIALFTFEFVLGVCLLLNVRIRFTSWLALLMMLCMTPLTLYIALKNPVSDCGCFGDALVISNWATFYKNLVLLVLTILLVLGRNKIRQTFIGKVEGGIFGLSTLAVWALALYGLLALPVIDFRPYKIGVNIEQAMEIPEDAEPDVYETTFVYAKDGVEQRFTIDNYPKDDSSWSFVRQESKLIRQGYVPPIHDFSIVTPDFEDITYDILTSEDYTVLVVMYDLQKTNRRQVAKLNALYEKAQAEGVGFYALTGSGTQAVADFVAETGAAYPFCTTDPVTLKTIVRANPGIVLIQNGVIRDKQNVRQIKLQ